MAKLDLLQSEKLMRISVRAQTKLMGAALDKAKLGFPETKTDRQLTEFTKELKRQERGLREFVMNMLVEAGYCEAVDYHVLGEMK